MVRDIVSEKIIEQGKLHLSDIKTFSLILLFILLVTSRYFYNTIWGPFVVNEYNLIHSGVEDWGYKYYYKILSSKSISAGVYETTIKQRVKDRSIISKDTRYYHFVPTEDNLLLVLSIKKNPAYSYKGKFEKLGSKLLNDIIDKSELNIRLVENQILPFYLVEGEKSNFWIYIWIALILFFISSIVRSIYKYLQAVNNITKSTIYHAISKHGVFNKIQNEINLEYDNKKIYEHDKLIITNNWIIFNTFESIERTKDLMWVYTSKDDLSIDNSIYFSMKFRDNNLLSTKELNEVEIDIILNKIHNIFPWIVIGDSEQRQRVWEIQREEFINHVDIKKDQLQNQK